MRVTFLGSGDAFGSGGRLQTCIHVQWAGGAFLVDCGTTALIGLKRAELDPGAVGLVLLTHLHGDHFGGLPFLLLDGQFTRRTAPLTIAGPPGTEARLRLAMEALFPGSSQVERKFAVDFAEWSPGARWARGGLAVTRRRCATRAARRPSPCASRQAGSRWPTRGTRSGWTRCSPRPGARTC